MGQLGYLPDNNPHPEHGLAQLYREQSLETIFGRHRAIAAGLKTMVMNLDR
jgi:hypothetical protein